MVGYMLVLVLATPWMAACGVSTPQSTVEPESQAEAVVRQVGDTQGTQMKVQLTNAMDAAITSMAFKGSQDEAFCDDLLGSEGPIESNETFELGLPVADCTYDVSLTVEGSEYVLHRLDLSKIESGVLQLSDGLAYLVYQDDEGTDISTLEDEQKLVQAAAEQAAAEQAAAEKAAAEQAAAEQAEAEQRAAEQAAAEGQAAKSAPQSQQGSSQEAPAQSEDSCLGDDVVFR